jgi:hypothetical protein
MPNPQMTNVQKLQQAGILATPHGLSDADVATINQLSRHEVDVWVKIKEQLGQDFVIRNAAKIMI